MNKVNPLFAGLALGAFAVLLHAAWSSVATLGYGPAAFDGGTTAQLLMLAGAGGVALGAVLAAIWNLTARRRS